MLEREEEHIFHSEIWSVVYYHPFFSFCANRNDVQISDNSLRGNRKTVKRLAKQAAPPCDICGVSYKPKLKAVRG